MTVSTATKKKALELAAMVNKALGDNDAVRMGDNPDFTVEFTPSGLLPVDIILNGGIPGGRFILMTGDYSTLKTYVGLNAVAEFQKQGKVCAIIDTEHSYEEAWAKSVGIDTSALILRRPATGELAIDTAEALVRGGADFILFDSIAAALPQTEAGKRLHNENIRVAASASLMSAACRRLTAANDRCAFMWINQLRVNVGVTFGSNETMNGGKAMGYYASYILNVKKVGKIVRDVKKYDGEKWVNSKEQIGQKYKLELRKSKLSKPFSEVLFDWDLVNNQIDLVGFLISQGVELGFVTLSGNTWKYGYGRKEVKAVGREKFRTVLAADANAMMALEDDVRGHYGLPSNGTPVAMQPAGNSALSSEPKKKVLTKGKPPTAKKVLRLRK